MNAQITMFNGEKIAQLEFENMSIECFDRLMTKTILFLEREDGKTQKNVIAPPATPNIKMPAVKIPEIGIFSIDGGTS
ncbi:hypothetical protein GFC29_3852 (plasmid) [Anoxybacillus sp. B7M1]|nr:hypothetical protein GFC29_3852 [Anoxybacillus sp. B7M1]